MKKVDVSDESIKLDLNGRQAILFERDLDYPQVVELPEAAKLSIVDLDSRDDLTVEEP
jgi:hypothetical protein